MHDEPGGRPARALKLRQMNEAVADTPPGWTRPKHCGPGRLVCLLASSIAHAGLSDELQTALTTHCFLDSPRRSAPVRHGRARFQGVAGA
jgi:hypothetical protein